MRIFDTPPVDITRRAAKILGLMLSLLLAGLPSRSAAAGKVSLETQIGEFELCDCQGDPHRLSRLQGSRGTVVIFFGVECPLARLYGSRLCELAQRYKDQVSFIGIDSNERDDMVEMNNWGKRYAPTLLLLRDPDQQIADLLGVTRNPEVVLLDHERRIRYRGRIDDQYTTAARKEKAVQHDLVDAIEQLITGHAIAVTETIATGCYIDRGKNVDQALASGVSYHRQIAPIIRRRCAGCHRAGQSAPFELTTYDQVSSWLDTIDEVIREQRMPPWFASPQYGEFKNFSGLTAQEIDLLHRWIDAGGPEGDPITATPLEPLPAGQWNIDGPDLVLSIPQPFTVPAEGVLEYQYFVVDPGFSEDKWVSAVELRPSNPAVVHHVNVWIDRSQQSKFSVDSWTRLTSGYLAVTAPGRPPMIFPEGMAKRIPAGSKLVFQLHYQSIGSTQVDQTRLGLKFADRQSITREVATRGLIAKENHLSIAAGDANHEVRLTQQLDHDLLLLALTPHMHLRGKSCRYEAIYPDGRQEVLLEIPRWDSNWQDRYVLSEPKLMPAGTQMIASAVFDNSAANPFNPDPTVAVEYGPQLTDEMFNAWFEAALANQNLTEPAIIRFVRMDPARRFWLPLAVALALAICCRLVERSN